MIMRMYRVRYHESVQKVLINDWALYTRVIPFRLACVLFFLMKYRACFGCVLRRKFSENERAFMILLVMFYIIYMVV